MFGRHTGNGWLSSGILIYAIIYLIMIRKQKNKVSFSLLYWYCAALFDITIFPIPINTIGLEHIQTKHTFRISLQILEGTSKLQNILNFIMFMPLGILVKNHFKKLSLLQVIAIIFMTTLSIEVLQLITSYFALNVRIFDVDDLFFNALGGITTYLAYQTIIQKKHNRS